MRKIHYAVGGEHARWKRKKQSRALQDRQSHQHPQIAADISTTRSAFAREACISSEISCSHRPVAGHVTHRFSRAGRPTVPWLQRTTNFSRLQVRQLVHV